jgi:hypothetical protein
MMNLLSNIKFSSFATPFLPINQPLKIFQKHIQIAHKQSCRAQACSAFFLLPLFILFLADRHKDAATIKLDQERLRAIISKIKNAEKTKEEIEQLSVKDKLAQLNDQIALVKQCTAEMEHFQSIYMITKYSDAILEADAELDSLSRAYTTANKRFGKKPY